MRVQASLRASAVLALAPLVMGGCTVIAQPDEQALYDELLAGSGGPGSSGPGSSGPGSSGSGSTSSGTGGAGAGGATTSSTSSGGGGAGGQGGAGGSGGAGGEDPACLGFPETAAPPPVVSFLAGVTVSTLAGSGQPGFVDGAGAAARFDNPVSLTFTSPAEDALFVTDFYNGAVRRVTVDGLVTTILSGEPTFVRPFGVALGPSGAIFVQTDANTAGLFDDTTGTLWVVDIDGLFDPQVIAEDVGRPRGLIRVGEELVLADIEHDVVRSFDVDSGAFTPLAGVADCENFVDGAGDAARFETPYGLAIDPSGDLVIADRGNHAIRRITAAGVVTTIAGTGSPGMVDGTLAAARFDQPIDVALDALGRIYVADLGNHRIRRVDEALDEVVTLAGDGVDGFIDGPGEVARFFGLEGIEVTADGSTVFVTDGTQGILDESFHRLRRVELP